MKIKIKRIYDNPGPDDGKRVLVDRLWPRGISKEKARIDLWAKEIAPSNELRKWFGHRPDKWDEFKKRYFSELDSMDEQLAPLQSILEEETITLIFSAKEIKYNNAAALREYLESKNIE